MKKNSYDYGKLSYTVNGQTEFDLTTALRLWKTKYDFPNFERIVTYHESLHDFRDFVKEMWEDIIPVTVEEAFKQTNAETRRTYFDAIGVEKLFTSLDPALRDKQVIKKRRARWDDKDLEYNYEFEDVYELYEIPGEKLFGTLNASGRNNTDPVFAVRCWCTTTNREYWLYVNNEAATGQRFINHDRSRESYDAIRAIAWTIRVDIDKIDRIYRQGDIIIVKEGKGAKVLDQYHLTKDMYLSLMYSET